MRLRKALRKIHRWVGLLSALWLLQLAITGLLLQQADNMGMSGTYVSSPTVLQWFDYGKRQTAWDAADATLYQIDDVISFNGIQHPWSDQLIGVAQVNNQLVAATQNGLLWFNQAGEMVQSMDDFDGIPTPITQVDFAVGGLFILVGEQWYSINQAAEIEAVLPPAVNSSVTPRILTAAEQKHLLPQVLTNKLSYDKVLLGIHSGIKSSVWLNSLSALALLFLCGSGIYLFFKQPKSKKS